MAHPNYNPPNDDCPECEKPSKTYFIGARRVVDEDEKPWTVTRYSCEHKHEWKTREPARL